MWNDIYARYWIIDTKVQYFTTRGDQVFSLTSQFLILHITSLPSNMSRIKIPVMFMNAKTSPEKCCKCVHWPHTSKCLHLMLPGYLRCASRNTLFLTFYLTSSPSFTALTLLNTCSASSLFKPVEHLYITWRKKTFQREYNCSFGLACMSTHRAQCTVYNTYNNPSKL